MEGAEQRSGDSVEEGLGRRMKDGEQSGLDPEGKGRVRSRAVYQEMVNK